VEKSPAFQSTLGLKVVSRIADLIARLPVTDLHIGRVRIRVVEGFILGATSAACTATRLMD
jgi:hypothetical protein